MADKKSKVKPKHKISLSEFARNEELKKFVVEGFRVWITIDKKWNLKTRTNTEWKKLYKQYLAE